MTPRPLTRLACTILLSLTVAACGTDDQIPPDDPKVRDAASASKPATETKVEPAAAAPEPAAEAEPDAAAAERPAGEAGLRVAAQQARIVAKRSQFGTVLFDANGQVVYAFENDRPGRSNCTSDECVTAWPPVLTKQAPTAGNGVTGAQLGTIRRDDGSLQVTYHGRPLYFYEHEAPGEIKCHDVDLHGGTWWVVTPDGSNAA